MMNSSTASLVESNLLLSHRRSCKCTKSKCLKLYCDCFASGEYCNPSCTCLDCQNNPAHDTVRRDAVIATLERTKNAFRPKLAAVAPEPDLTTTKHHKGCHCRKSNCLKKYCECFQSGVPCSELCRCVDCKNHSSHDPDYYDDVDSPASSPMKRLRGEGPPSSPLNRGKRSSQESRDMLLQAARDAESNHILATKKAFLHSPPSARPTPTSGRASSSRSSAAAAQTSPTASASSSAPVDADPTTPPPAAEPVDPRLMCEEEDVLAAFEGCDDGDPALSADRGRPKFASAELYERMEQAVLQTLSDTLRTMTEMAEQGSRN